MIADSLRVVLVFGMCLIGKYKLEDVRLSNKYLYMRMREEKRREARGRGRGDLEWLYSKSK